MYKRTLSSLVSAPGRLAGECEKVEGGRLAILYGNGRSLERARLHVCMAMKILII